MKTIFLIEDDYALAQAIKKQIESWGNSVVTVKDFQHVMEEFEAAGNVCTKCNAEIRHFCSARRLRLKFALKKPTGRARTCQELEEIYRNGNESRRG